VQQNESEGKSKVKGFPANAFINLKTLFRRNLTYALTVRNFLLKTSAIFYLVPSPNNFAQLLFLAPISTVHVWM
jgi:hypothetical protein